MWNRLVNAIVTRLAPTVREAVREELDAQTDQQRKEVRALVIECEDILDKLTRRAAREGMRRSREVKQTIEEVSEVAPPHNGEAIGTATSAAHLTKEQLRAQFGHLLLKGRIS